MPAPYNYAPQRYDAGSYIDAFRAGVDDRRVAQDETRQNALSKYLPGALKGDQDARAQALAGANPDQQIALTQQFAQMDQATKAREFEALQKSAQILYGVKQSGNPALALEQAKPMLLRIGASPEQIAGLSIENLDAVIASATSLSDQFAREDRQRSFGLQERQFAESSRHNRAMEGLSAAARLPKPNIDPNTGIRVAPPGVQGKDYSQLSKFEQSADAAASIAATLRGVAPALDRIETGPGTGTGRAFMGVMSMVPGLQNAKDFVNNYDAIEQASKTIGIDTLQKVGGSDTERELLTAIQTTVNPDVRPEENMRRFKDQIAAADILAQKAKLASEWVNKFGSLAYAAPDGTTWQGFWPQYQKAAWSDHRKQLQQRPQMRGQGGAQPAQSRGPAPPAGFEVVP